MPKKRKMVQYNLIKNSISAFLAAVEIHNKPTLRYRYETSTLLIVNAWELIIKAYIKKYYKGVSIYKKDNKKETIGLDYALLVLCNKDNCDSKDRKRFDSIRSNLELIIRYRNECTHFYSEDLTPYIFALVAKSAVNYVDFVKKYFNKDIIKENSIFILPIGFELPFDPVDFLSTRAIQNLSSDESKQFVSEIVRTIRQLDSDDNQNSIVVGFDVLLKSVKDVSNYDLLVAINSNGESDVSINVEKKINTCGDSTCAKYNLTDEQAYELYPYNYRGVTDWCRIYIPDFKTNIQFTNKLKELRKDQKYALKRTLSKSDKSPSTFIYNSTCLDELKNWYEKQ